MICNVCNTLETIASHDGRKAANLPVVALTPEAGDAADGHFTWFSHFPS